MLLLLSNRTAMNFKLKKITIAATNITEMATFYTSVFNAGLTPIEAYGTTLYTGQLCGFDLLLCPNSIAGVEAQQNRQQFDIEVPDIESALKAAETSGGKIKDPLTINPIQNIASVTDPDGNTIVLTSPST